MSDIVEFPDKLMLRDTRLFDDLGGLGQHIYTTAGAGYKKVEYVRGDLVESLRQRVAELESELANAYKTVDDNWVAHQQLTAMQNELAAIKGKQEPVAWMRNNTLWSVVKVQQHYPDDGWPYQPLCLCTAPIPEGWTQREIAVFDGMIEVGTDHAERCDMIANRVMAEKQKGWDLERVALLRKCKAMLSAAPKPESKNKLEYTEELSRQLWLGDDKTAPKPEEMK